VCVSGVKTAFELHYRKVVLGEAFFCGGGKVAYLGVAVQDVDFAFCRGLPVVPGVFRQIYRIVDMPCCEMIASTSTDYVYILAAEHHVAQLDWADGKVELVFKVLNRSFRTYKGHNRPSCPVIYTIFAWYLPKPPDLLFAAASDATD